MGIPGLRILPQPALQVLWPILPPALSPSLQPHWGTAFSQLRLCTFSSCCLEFPQSLTHLAGLSKMSPFISEGNSYLSSSPFSFPFCRTDSSSGALQHGACPTDSTHHAAPQLFTNLPWDCDQRAGTHLIYICQDGSQLSAQQDWDDRTELKERCPVIVILAARNWSHPPCPPRPRLIPWGSPSSLHCPGPPSPQTPEWGSVTVAAVIYNCI